MSSLRNHTLLPSSAALIPCSPSIPTQNVDLRPVQTRSNSAFSTTEEMGSDDEEARVYFYGVEGMSRALGSQRMTSRARQSSGSRRHSSAVRPRRRA